MQLTSSNRRRPKTGATLLTVIFFGLVLSAIGSTAYIVASQGTGRATQERGRAAAFQVADSATEYVRNAFMQDYGQSSMTSSAWRNAVVTGTRSITVLGQLCGAGSTCITPDDYNITNSAASDDYPTRSYNLTNAFNNFYTNASRTSSGARNVVARVFNNSLTSNFTVKVTAVLADGSETTVVKGFGSAGQPGGNISILTRNINCAFCHLQITGDVGALGHVRPGWDAKSACTDVGYNELTGVQGTATGGCASNGDGVKADNNMARGQTQIRGNFYNLQRFTDDNNTSSTLTNSTNTSISKTLNNVKVFKDGTDTTAPFPQVQVNWDVSTNEAVATRDIDGDGVSSNDINPVDLNAASSAASGSAITVMGSSTSTLIKPTDYATQDLSSLGLAGGMWTITKGGTYDANLTKVNSVMSGTTGTLILIGTKSDPVRLPSDFYFNGDVIIKGYVKGDGNLTAARNVYVAGELLYVNPPGTGGSGNYRDLTDANIAAQAKTDSLNSNLDSLRIYSGNNIIVGDYTNKDASGTIMDPLARQAEYFMRSQFGLNTTGNSNSSLGGFSIYNGNRYFSKSTGDELYCVKNTAGKCGTYLTTAGARVSDAPATQPNNGSCTNDVCAFNSQAAYDYALKPGVIASTGAFAQTLSDENYRQIMGLQNVSGTKVSWRNDGNLSQYSQSGTLGCKTSTGLPVACTSSSATDRCATKCAPPTLPVGTLPASVGNMANTMINQVERIDASLYASRRVAGVIRGTNLMINGGITVRDFGVLAGAAEGSISPSTAIQNLTTGCGNTANKFKFVGGLGNNNVYCNGLDFGTSNSGSTTATNTGVGLLVNYDFRNKGGSLQSSGSRPGAVTFFRLGNSSDRTF